MTLSTEEKQIIDHFHLMTDAVELAARLHHNQFRKDGVTPYIVHPMRVMMLTWELSHSREYSTPVSLAALFHDVGEDCGIHGMRIVEDFLTKNAKSISFPSRMRVLSMVGLLTMNKTLPKKARIEKCIGEIISKEDYGAALIKLCDRLDNLRSICNLDTKFQKRYLGETKAILRMFYKFVDPDTSCQIAWDMLRREYDYWEEILKVKKE